jgi:hypothetical protein
MPSEEPSKAADATHSGERTIEAIDKDELTLSHGPIPSLKWGRHNRDVCPDTLYQVRLHGKSSKVRLCPI